MSETMGERIYKRRIELNMTMQELGDKVGVQASAVNKWEKGLVENIKASTIKKLSAALEISPAYLMIGTDVDHEKYSYVNSAAFAEILLDRDSQELIAEINTLNKNEKKELLTYAQFLKKKREG